MRTRSVLLAAVAALLAAVLLAPPGARADPQVETSPNLKVAFIGDQGVNANAEAVLSLIAAEGADLVVHLGDLGYGNETDPARAIAWDAQVTSVLGADFPYFAAAGNHDAGNWATYQSLLLDRLALVPGASCTGDYGVMSTCTYQGLTLVLSGAGTIPNAADHQGHVDYVRSRLAADNSVWRICAWHKNQTAMQVGAKGNEAGWGVYEACRQGRAIVATAHEHSYERTRTLRSLEHQSVDPLWPDGDVLDVRPGATFAFVSGLGGQSIRPQLRCLPDSAPYGCSGEWASISSSNQGANYGALFIEFNVDGNPRKADGYFKNIDGTVVDSFTVFSAPPPQAAPADSDGDGCTDAAEGGPDAQSGGRRDYLNPWDFFDTDGNRLIDLFTDIIGVASAFGQVPGDPGYATALDRSAAAPGADPWALGPPDGTIDLFTDVIGAAYQFGHDCS